MPCAGRARSPVSSLSGQVVDKQLSSRSARRSPKNRRGVGAVIGGCDARRIVVRHPYLRSRQTAVKARVLTTVPPGSTVAGGERRLRRTSVPSFPSPLGVDHDG